MRRTAVLTAALEVRTEATSGFNLSTGERFEGVDVSYRSVGARLWTKFLVVLEDEQTISEVEDNALELAELHRARSAA